MQAWGRDTEGFNSPLFEDPRTQRAVERKWTQEIQGRMYTRLCFWVRSLLLQSTTATCGAWFACFGCSGLTTCGWRGLHQVLFVCFLMFVAIWQTGRDSLYVRAFHKGMEETVVFDEADPHHTVSL